MDNNESPNLYNLVQSDENIEILRKVLAGGVNINVEYSHGETLLHIACMSVNDNVEVVKALIKAGLNADRSNSLLYKPLHYAVIYRKRKVVEALLQCRMDINSKDDYRKTALHYAVYNMSQHTDSFPNIPSYAPDLYIVRKLLDHKDVNVDEKDALFETPLMLAVRDKQLAIVKLLLSHGAKLDTVNVHGLTPLHFALAPEVPCPYTVVLFLLKRADILVNDCQLLNPLTIILRYESLHFACQWLKIIVAISGIEEGYFKLMTTNSILLQVLSIYFDEINRMKNDRIVHQLTVYDFFAKRALQLGLSNPVSKIYEPIIERIITGRYPEYFCYILHLIPTSNLSEVLASIVDKKYCIKNGMDEEICEDKNCTKEHRTPCSEVFRNGLMSGYLERFDLFCLILMFSGNKINESFRNVRHDDCYLGDSLQEYSEDYFSLS